MNGQGRREEAEEKGVYHRIYRQHRIAFADKMRLCIPPSPIIATIFCVISYYNLPTGLSFADNSFAVGVSHPTHPNLATAL